MKVTTQKALIEMLKAVNGASFISIDTCTTPTINKTLGGRGKDAIPNPHYGRIQKVMTGAVVMVFQNKTINGYEAMVNRRLAAEGKDPASFTLGPRKWGTRMENLPVVEHEGQYYLEVIFLKPGPVQYFLDGHVIDKDLIQGLREPAVDETQQGGLENQVVIRSFKFDSITRIKIDKNTFILGN